MGFVAVEIFCLLDFFAFLGFDLALVLGSPAGVWIMRAFVFPFALLSLAVFTFATLCTLSTICIEPN